MNCPIIFLNWDNKAKLVQVFFLLSRLFLLHIWLLICFYPFFVLSEKPKTRIKFQVSSWSGNEKYFCFLFKSSRALLSNHTEFNRFLKRNFLTCYSCSYYTLCKKCQYMELFWSAFSCIWTEYGKIWIISPY